MEEFIWENLHYALDGLDKFSVISAYPELPFTYTKNELDRYKLNVINQLSWYDHGQGIWKVSTHTYEEIFELYPYFIQRGYKVKISADYANGLNYVPEYKNKRRWFYMDNIKNHTQGFPFDPKIKFMYDMDPRLMDGCSPREHCVMSYVNLDILVSFNKLDRFIEDIKGLRKLSYKNVWLYYEREIQVYEEINNKLLIR